jgi:hypothetical protein
MYISREIATSMDDKKAIERNRSKKSVPSFMVIQGLLHRDANLS